jgi:hypothetical protein
MFSRRAHHKQVLQVPGGAEPHSRPHGSECSQHIFDDKVSAAGAPTISHRQSTSFGRKSACGAGAHRYQVPRTGLSPFSHAPKQIHSMAMKEHHTPENALSACTLPHPKEARREPRRTLDLQMVHGWWKATGARGRQRQLGSGTCMQTPAIVLWTNAIHLDTHSQRIGDIEMLHRLPTLCLSASWMTRQVRRVRRQPSPLIYVTRKHHRARAQAPMASYGRMAVSPHHTLTCKQWTRNK